MTPVRGERLLLHCSPGGPIPSPGGDIPTTVVRVIGRCLYLGSDLRRNTFSPSISGCLLINPSDDVAPSPSGLPIPPLYAYSGAWRSAAMLHSDPRLASLIDRLLVDRLVGV